MSARIRIFYMLLVFCLSVLPNAASATDLVCPTVQEAKNLLSGAFNILRAAKNNNGDFTSAIIPYAECRGVYTMVSPGTLISKGHYVLAFYLDGNSGIANASKYLNEYKMRIRKIILDKNANSRNKNNVFRAWLYRKMIKDQEHGVISVK